MTSKTQISEIVIYPLKGCRGQTVQSVNVTEMGLVGDREFAVLLAGQRANQKQVPLLFNLSARWLDENRLQLSFPNEVDFFLDTSIGEPTDAVSIYSKRMSVLDMGPEVSRWLSGVLQAQVNLVRMRQPVKWFLPIEEFSGVHDQAQTKFIDAAPVLLTNENSLADLNDRIGPQAEEGLLAMNRFRPNIVISGLSPYLEDDLPEFDFPGLSLKRITVCERCIVTTTNQETGVRGKEPLLTLSKFRKRENDYAGGIMFGIYLKPEGNGTISVGDLLEVE